jgi:hypothetical protein
MRTVYASFTYGLPTLVYGLYTDCVCVCACVCVCVCVYCVRTAYGLSSVALCYAVGGDFGLELVGVIECCWRFPKLWTCINDL